MNIKDQVCSLELAKQIKELGVKQESYLTHIKHPFLGWVIYDVKSANTSSFFESERYSAFSVPELGEILITANTETKLITYRSELGYYGVEIKERYLSYADTGDTEADARARLLIVLIEHKIILAQ